MFLLERESLVVKACPELPFLCFHCSKLQPTNVWDCKLFQGNRHAEFRVLSSN